MTDKQTTTVENPLSHLLAKAAMAYNNTSFSPQKRGESMINDYGQQLSEDMHELQVAGIDEPTIESYKARYVNLFSSYLAAKSRCISWMITGPANFPTRRAEKANRSEERHYQLWQVWRLKAKKAILRKAQPQKTYLSEIERYRNDLDSMRKNHELMKQGNAAIAKAVKTGTDISEYLVRTFNIPPHMIDWHMKFGFGLKNNLANMKRVEQRIKELESKERNRNGDTDKSYRFAGGEVVLNYEADRVQVLFDEKPNEELRTVLKKHGFKWSPRYTAWQRQLTQNAIYVASGLFKKL